MSSFVAKTSDMTPNNVAADVKPQGSDGAPKVKPCCVCKDEKAARDECMLLSTAADPQLDCKSLIGKYKDCMKGHGFNV